MGWFRSLLVSPLKKLWVRLHSPHRNRNHSNSIIIIISLLFGRNYHRPPPSNSDEVLLFLDVGKGIYILYKDVKSCPCEDVQMLWSILVEAGSSSSHPPSPP
ncbi:hypothetical protein SDJN03_26554, partial [Cucurbita argyrosperma subsp. sororia]